MPPLPVIAGIFRVTLNWNSDGGITPRNVLHIQTATGDEEEVADALHTALVANVDAVQMISINYAVVTYDVLKLDGSSATVTVNAPDDDARGGASGQIMPSTATVLSMRTAQRGPRGRGRLYLGPAAEGLADAGYVPLTQRSTTPAAWQALNEDLLASPIAAGIYVASYVHGTAVPVTSFSVRPPFGTQRRRQNQLVA